MAQKELAIGEVRMSFTGGEAQAERTERIARLTFDHVHRLMDGGLRKMNGHWLIVHDHVSVPTDFESGKAMLDLKP